MARKAKRQSAAGRSKKKESSSAPSTPSTPSGHGVPPPSESATVESGRVESAGVESGTVESKLKERPRPAPIVGAVQTPAGVRQRHLWQYTTVRDVFWIGAVVGLIWLGYVLSAIVTPILIALALAYLVQPVVVWVRDRFGVSRGWTIGILLAVMLLCVAGFSAWLAPKLINQSIDLVGKMPGYIEDIADRYQVDVGDLRERVESLAEEAQTRPGNYVLGALRFVLGGAGSAADVIAGVFGAGASIALSAVLIPVFFVAFAVKFESIVDGPKQYIPASMRERTFEIAGEMDRVVSTFFRVRVVIGFIMGVMFSVGWWMAGVPYWFVLGMGAGLLSLIPYAAGIMWPLAVLLMWLDVTSGEEAEGFSWMAVVVWPSVVYFVVQAIEGWGLTPLMQGQGLNLSALTILLAVLIGGSLGGMYGLLLCVPLTACMKIFMVEVMLPRLRGWAAEQ